MTEPHPPAAGNEVVEYHPFLIDQIQPHAREYRVAAMGTAAFHILLVSVLWLLPTHQLEHEREPQPLRRVTPLVDPPLTQTARNKAPLSNEISVPAPNLPAPEKTAAPRKKFEPPPPAQVTQKQNPAPALPQEPPKVIQPQTQQTAPVIPPLAVQPPPKTVDQPKLVLENVPPPPSGPGNGRLKVPAGGVQEAINEIAKSGQTSSRSVGDNTDDVAPDFSFGKTPVPTRPKSSLELLSDPKGVDFRPYLIQVLQTIRMNWRAVYPESARLGTRGRVVVQFAVAPDGTITKVVFTTESGSQALDRASVAAISMSNRLPPLPAGYTGERIVLQLNFLYNAAR
jgi:TonB family protein